MENNKLYAQVINGTDIRGNEFSINIDHRITTTSGYLTSQCCYMHYRGNCTLIRIHQWHKIGKKTELESYDYTITKGKRYENIAEARRAAMIILINSIL